MLSRRPCFLHATQEAVASHLSHTPHTRTAFAVCSLTMLSQGTLVRQRRCCVSRCPQTQLCCSPVLYVSCSTWISSHSRVSRLRAPSGDARSSTALQAWSLILPEAAQAAVATVQAEIAAHSTGELALMSPGAIWWPLLLSTLAGLSTAIGGLIAVSFAPSEGTLAFLLGTAIGVMATVSAVELWWHSAVEQHDFLGISAAVAAGAVLFAVLDPLLPKHEEAHHEDSKNQPETAAAVADGSPGTTDQEQHVAVDMQPRHLAGSGMQQQLPAAHNSSRKSSNEAQLAGTPLLQASHSNGSSRPSSSGSSSSNVHLRQQQQQLAVWARSQQSATAVKAESSGVAAAATAVDAELEHLPLLDASSSSSSSRDQLHKAHYPHNGDSHDGAAASTKLFVVGGTVQQSQQQICKSQQQQSEPGIVLQQQQQQQQSEQGMILQQQQQQQQQEADEVARLRAHHAGMLRLGLLMTITLTIHNLPEGFAVAFSAFTNIGPIMALAIALHNIPEGLVIAAPLYAATGSKLKALGMTAASGLSEPVGALLALLVFKPFVTSLAQLDYVLAVTGGVMLAVCVLELWPEGRRCGQDVRLMQGIALGTVVMGWTLYVGV